MKPVLAVLVGLVGMAVTLSAPAPLPGRKGAIKREWQRLNGTWEIVSFVVDGKKMPAHKVHKEKPTVTFQDGKYTTKLGGKVVREMTAKLDPTTSPRSMDIIPGPDEREIRLAIYDLKGDSLRICFAGSGQPRPKAFESKKGNSPALITYKRVKPRD